MRLMVIVFFLVTLIVFDQTRMHGYRGPSHVQKPVRQHQKAPGHRQILPEMMLLIGIGKVDMEESKVGMEEDGGQDREAREYTSGQRLYEAAIAIDSQRDGKGTLQRLMNGGYK